MAPGTSNLGWLAAAAVCVALVVTGCGGGGSSSSAPATAGSTDAQSAETGQSANGGAEGRSEEKAGGETEGGKQAEQNGGGNAEKKNSPVETPEGSPEKGSTKEQEENVPTAEIALSIPHGLTTENTCKGNNVSPKLSWTGVPPGTEELEIFAVNVEPVGGTLYFDWAMAGVDPSVTSIEEGEVPAGAILGRNGEGKNEWSLCPKNSKPETYIFSVYAISKKLSPEEGFEPVAQRVEAGKFSEQVGLEGVAFGG